MHIADLRHDRRELELRAEEAEHSAIPIFLKIGKVIVWIVYALAVLTAFLLVMAFLLRLAGANPGSAFVDWVYRNAELAMRPFRGIFPTHESAAPPSSTCPCCSQP